MENLIVATFTDAANANDGLNKIKDLDELGDIVIYNLALIRKTAAGTLEFLYHNGPDFENIPAKGLLAGSLIGLTAGPIGIAVGAVTGAMAGAIDEDGKEDFSYELLERVSKQLKPGDHALLIDVEEDSPTFIDIYLGESDADIVRTDLIDDYDKYDDEQDIEMTKAIDEAEAELRKASEKNKAAIEAKITALKEKRETRRQKRKERWERSKQHLHEKIEHLNQKIAAAQGAQKEKLKAYNQKVKQRLDKFNKKVDWAFA